MQHRALRKSGRPPSGKYARQPAACGRRRADTGKPQKTATSDWLHHCHCLSELLMGAFLPDQIMTAEKTDLPSTYGSVAFYSAIHRSLRARRYSPMSTLGIGGVSYRQLALLPDRFFDQIACRCRIVRPTTHNDERRRVPHVPAWAFPVVIVSEGFIHFRRRDERVCTIELSIAGRRRGGLRIRGGEQTEKSDNPQPSNVLLHVLAFPHFATFFFPALAPASGPVAYNCSGYRHPRGSGDPEEPLRPCAPGFPLSARPAERRRFRYRSPSDTRQSATALLRIRATR